MSTCSSSCLVFGQSLVYTIHGMEIDMRHLFSGDIILIPRAHEAEIVETCLIIGFEVR